MRKLFALLLLATGVASAAIPAYMTIAGIEGGSNVGGREGTVEVHEFSQTIESPIDPTNFTPTGRARHGLATFIKSMDRATAPLITRTLNQTVIPSIIVKWYRIDDKGDEVLYLEYRYTNVRILKIRPHSPHVKDVDKQRYTHQEEITFSYRVMSVTYHHDGNSGPFMAGGTSSVAW